MDNMIRKDTVDFYNKESTQYSKKRYEGKTNSYFQFLFKRRRQLFLAFIDSVKGELKDSKALEIGCADGVIVKKLLQKLPDSFKTITGVDVSPKMIEISKNRLKDKATINLDSIESFSPKNKFNYIFSIDSFHHYANQEKAILNLHQTLKKGGKLIISDFSLGRLGNWFFKKFEPSNSRMLSKKEFKELFEKHKFGIIKQKRVGLFSIVTTGVK